MKVLTPVLLSILLLVTCHTGADAATPVDLGTAGDYAILAKTGITTTAGTMIVGDIGVSPIAASAIVGFGLVLDPSGQFSTSSLVTGQVFASDYAAPTPTMLSAAIGDMEAAYTNAAGQADPDFVNLSGGNLNGEALTAGLYKWTSAVTITDSISLDGGGDPNSVWVFQIDNRLILENGSGIILTGGAQAQNIFWQTAEGATLGTGSHFEGILLTATDIAVQTGASVNGNLYAQTAVTLQGNSITQAVPEPAAAMLFLGGTVLCVGLRRHRDR